MINEQLKTLYETRYTEKIITCGVVDEAIYTNTYPKIVFLLKEPNSEDNNWSLPKGLQRNVGNALNNKAMDKKYMVTWRQAGAWAYGIAYGFNTYNQLKKDIFVAKGLQTLAMTNLKKTGGKGSSNMRLIAKFAIRDSSIWREELRIMNPDLIICGGTYGLVVKVLGLACNLLLAEGSEKYYYSFLELDGKKAVILSFWHPNARRKREDNMRTLELCVNKLRVMGLLDKSLP
jgi:hypothetical protein